jgi:hypothetical protein
MSDKNNDNSIWDLIGAFVDIAINLQSIIDALCDEISNNPFVRFGKPATLAKPTTSLYHHHKRQIQLQRFQPRMIYKRFPVISRYSE